MNDVHGSGGDPGERDCFRRVVRGWFGFGKPPNPRHFVRGGADEGIGAPNVPWGLAGVIETVRLLAGRASSVAVETGHIVPGEMVASLRLLAEHLRLA